jgi:hypothetical protein
LSICSEARNNIIVGERSLMSEFYMNAIEDFVDRLQGSLSNNSNGFEIHWALSGRERASPNPLQRRRTCGVEEVLGALASQ